MDDLEEWRTIPSFPSYRVSNFGRVLGPSGKILRQFDGRGYKKLTLMRDGVVHCKTVHRLVLDAFSGPCPEGMEACHNDGVRDNNRASNLRYDTRAANFLDAIKHGKRATGPRPTIKLDNDAILDIRASPKFWGSQSRLAEKYNVSNSTIRDVLRGKTRIASQPQKDRADEQ